MRKIPDFSITSPALSKGKRISLLLLLVLAASTLQQVDPLKDSESVALSLKTPVLDLEEKSSALVSQVNDLLKDNKVKPDLVLAEFSKVE